MNDTKLYGSDIHTNKVRPTRITSIGCFAQLYTGLIPNDFNNIPNSLENIYASAKKLYKFIKHLLLPMLGYNTSNLHRNNVLTNDTIVKLFDYVILTIDLENIDVEIAKNKALKLKKYSIHCLNILLILLMMNTLQI